MSNLTFTNVSKVGLLEIFYQYVCAPFPCCSIACLQIRKSPHLPRGVAEAEPVLHRPEGTGPLLADVSVLLEAIPAGAPAGRGGRRRRRLRGAGGLKEREGESIFAKCA